MVSTSSFARLSRVVVLCGWTWRGKTKGKATEPASFFRLFSTDSSPLMVVGCLGFAHVLFPLHLLVGHPPHVEAAHRPCLVGQGQDQGQFLILRFQWLFYSFTSSCICIRVPCTRKHVHTLARSHAVSHCLAHSFQRWKQRARERTCIEKKNGEHKEKSRTKNF